MIVKVALKAHGIEISLHTGRDGEVFHDYHHKRELWRLRDDNQLRHQLSSKWRRSESQKMGEDHEDRMQHLLLFPNRA